MQLKNILSFLVMCLSFQTFSQDSTQTATLKKSSYISIQSGGMIDGYNTTGIRAFVEYQKDINKNLQYGISFDQSFPLYSSATDFTNELTSYLSILSLNGYYKLYFWKDKIFWTGGLGVGAVYANWGNDDKLGAVVNGSLTLNFKLTKRLYLETMPVIFAIPANRIYFSTMNAETHKSFFAFTIIPFGIKIKL